MTCVKVNTRPAPISRFRKKVEIMRAIGHLGSDITRVKTRGSAELKSFSVESLKPLLEAAGDIQRDLMIIFLYEPGKAGNIVGRVLSVKLYVESVIVFCIGWGEYFHNSRLVRKLALKLTVNKFSGSCYHSIIIVLEVVIHSKLPLNIFFKDGLQSKNSPYPGQGLTHSTSNVASAWPRILNMRGQDMMHRSRIRDKRVGSCSRKLSEGVCLWMG